VDGVDRCLFLTFGSRNRLKLNETLVIVANVQTKSEPGISRI
jgi:hypothetical protein